jgi:hypothetical protein
MAAALDGGDGLLSRALGTRADVDPAGAGGPLAASWSASVIGSPRAPALAVRVTAGESSLDAAVAQVRALLDRLRQGGLRDEDWARAGAALARHRLTSSLDPRARALALWRGDPPLPSVTAEELRAFAAANLRDDSLIIVAARAQRPESRLATGHDPKPRARE